ncbi:MAG TPA: acetyl-CoA C-acetyltransferase [Sporichthyaceae bacterium]|jgi:acetyl-CoA acyltransferase
MRDAVIVEAVRTPVGRRNGGLAGVHPTDLSAHVLDALVSRAGLDPALVDDVVWGCVSQAGEQTWDIARKAVIAAGWPQEVTGVTIDRQCGSSQQSVHFAAAGLIAGHYDVVVAGGVESMSRVPMGFSAQGADPLGPRYLARVGVTPNQGVGAEMIASQWGLSRTQVDEYAVASHERAGAARAEGRFDAQIAPITLPDGTVVAQDEGRADPVIMLTAPIPATAKALKRSGLSLDQIGAFEVNEAFAPVPMAWLAEFPTDAKALNPNGGAIALGHPLGGSGARLMTTLVHHMRDNGIRYGLQTMCEGGGQANATVLELL